MKKGLLFVILMGGLISGFCQEHAEDANIPENEMGKFRPARLFGKVVEGKSNKGVEAVSVQVFVKKRDSMTKVITDTLVAGMLTKPNGDFSFLNLPLPDSFQIKFSAIGFSETTQDVRLGQKPEDGSPLEKDLGNISLPNLAEFLSAVTVVAQSPTVQMGIDRKIFNVDKSLTSAGGTGVDVMRNIPSVTVDAEGNIQLRNSSPQIFVDGRPTILTLDQIPADDIEKVELITNPSAKFDAASSGGIINVVLKKNRRAGFNGIVSGGIGIPDILNGGISLNLRQGKFNIFGSVNYNDGGGVAKSETLRQNKVDGVKKDYFNQVSQNDRNRLFTSYRYGVDFFMDNRNTFTISQNYVKGKFTNLETQDQQYLDIQKVMVRSGLRTSNGEREFHRNNYQFNYTHKFPKAGKELTSDITYNNGSSVNGSEISNYYYYPDGSPYAEPDFVHNRGYGNNNQTTVQLDYVDPITETSKIEMGLRTYRSNNTSVLNAYSVEYGSETKLPISANVKYNETVHAAYTTYTNKWKSIRYQVGLRGEYSLFNGLLVDSAKKFGYELPIDLGSIMDGLFPSIYLSKSIGESQEIQLNFSRRISRPDFWQSNPYIDITDPLNINKGNPALRPEYTNLFEFNYSHQYSQGSFLGVLYYRNNTGDITNYTDTISDADFQKLNNASIDPNAIVNSYINSQYTNRVGAEFTLQYKFGNLELIPNVNLQYRRTKAVINDLNLDNQGGNWEGKLTVNYKLKSKSIVLKNLNLQFRGEYESPRVIPQGRYKEQYGIDLALRKEFAKNNAASLTLSLNDALNSQRWGQIYDTESFYQDAYRRWNVRNIRLSFRYRFGNRDFNLFGKDKKNHEQGPED